MKILCQCYNGLIAHCDQCGALLGYNMKDIYGSNFIYCPQCNNKIEIPIDINYDGLVKETKDK